VNCAARYVQSDGTLGTAPFYKTGIDWGTVYVTGEEIIPGKQYVVQSELLADPTDLSDKRRATTFLWGDTDNSGITELADLICIIDGYGRLFMSPCTFERANLYPCDPQEDNLIEIGDLLAVLDAYNNYSYLGSMPDCSNPCPTPPPVPSAGGETPDETPPNPAPGIITMTATPSTIAPGGTVTIDLFVSTAGDLRGYQAGLETNGGTRGTLTRTSLEIDTEDPNFVFDGLDYITAVNTTSGRWAAALYP